MSVTFYATWEQAEAKVEPAWWHAPDAEYVAILRLEGPLPRGGGAVPHGILRRHVWSSLEDLQFPDARPEEGIWSDGHILEATRLQGVQVLQLSSPQITPSFSDAPILDTVTRRVV